MAWERAGLLPSLNKGILTEHCEVVEGSLEILHNQLELFKYDSFLKTDQNINSEIVL